MTRTVNFPGRIRRKGKDDPTYALEVAVENDGEVVAKTWVRMPAECLLKWTKVKTSVFIAVNIVPMLQTAKRESQQEKWETFINEITENIETEDAPGEASDAGLIAEMAMEWLSGRAVAETWNEWQRGDHRYVTPGGMALFRARDLRQHLDYLHHLPPPRQLWDVLSERGFKAGVQKVEGRAVKCWWLPSETLSDWDDELGHTSVNGHVSGGPVTADAPSYQLNHI